MANTELFESMDVGLRELHEHLLLVKGLLRRAGLDERLMQAVADLTERAGYHERALRPRLGLPQTVARPSRSETVALLEKKGLAVEETPQLILAGLQQCQEHARVLEGYFRFFNLPRVSEFYRRLRFETLELARLVVLKTHPEPGAATAVQSEPAPRLEPEPPPAGLAQALKFCPLYFILDESICSFRDPLRTAVDAVSAGVRVMQVRFKQASSRELLALAKRVGLVCAEHGCLLIVNDRVDIALMSGAAGVHLGAQDVEPADVRLIAHELLIGVTARTVPDAQAAQAAGADYLGCGSVFPSRTKPGLPVIGTSGIRLIASAVSIPVVGIGGITLDNCVSVLKAGAAGVCSVTPFSARRSVRNLAAQFRDVCRAALGAKKG
jgi:thiamine-phosphate diphosphorylase